MTTALPTPNIVILTLGDREYELVPLLEPRDHSIDGNEMVLRAKCRNANSGEDDGRFILDHQTEVPGNLWEKMVLVFPAWRYPGRPGVVACFGWSGGLWVQHWSILDGRWRDDVRLVRRRLPTSKAGK